MQERSQVSPVPEADFLVIARAQLEIERAWTKVFILAPGRPESQLSCYQNPEAMSSEES